MFIQKRLNYASNLSKPTEEVLCYSETFPFMVSDCLPLIIPPPTNPRRVVSATSHPERVFDVTAKFRLWLANQRLRGTRTGRTSGLETNRLNNSRTGLTPDTRVLLTGNISVSASPVICHVSWCDCLGDT